MEVDEVVDKFEIITKHKDSQPSNLNSRFASYGCGMLEAKIPIVDDRVAEKVKNSNFDQQRYETLALKSEAASLAVEGRRPRTKDRRLELVEIGRDVVIAAGKQREKSPVDRVELDDDLEEYMRVTAEIRAKKAKEKEDRKQRSFMLPEVSLLHNRVDIDWDE